MFRLEWAPLADFRAYPLLLCCEPVVYMYVSTNERVKKKQPYAKKNENINLFWKLDLEKTRAV